MKPQLRLFNPPLSAQGLLCLHRAKCYGHTSTSGGLHRSFSRTLMTLWRELSVTSQDNTTHLSGPVMESIPPWHSRPPARPPGPSPYAFPVAVSVQQSASPSARPALLRCYVWKLALFFWLGGPGSGSREAFMGTQVPF